LQVYNEKNFSLMLSMCYANVMLTMERFFHKKLLEAYAEKTVESIISDRANMWLSLHSEIIS